MNSLLLDRTIWDLCKDANGDIALAAEPYSVLQDVSSAVRLFLGELWYDTGKGIPYFDQILGKPAAPQLLKGQIERAALSVPQVVSAACFLGSIEGRSVTGQIQLAYLRASTGGDDSVSGIARAVLTFVGDNGGVLVFVGDNGGVLTFTGRG